MKSNTFFSPQRYLQTRQDVIHPTTSKRGRREWVLSRGLCHYRLFSLTELPASHWDEALSHKIRQWSPFKNYDSYIVWKQDKAQVWVWDKSAQQEALEIANLKQAVCIPESLLYPIERLDKENTLRLLKGLEGFEGQVWRDGVLMGSRWWENSPSLMQWHSFCRSYGFAITENVLDAQEFTLLSKPWGKPRGSFSPVHLRQERLWVTLGIIALIAVLTWESIHIFHQQQALISVQTRIDELTAQSTPILTARNSAISDKQYVDYLRNLNALPSQLTIFSEVIKQMPKDAQLVEWFYQTGELRFTLQADNIDPRVYVKNFGKIIFFKDVKSTMGRKSNRIIMTAKL